MSKLPENFQFSKTFEVGSFQVNPKGQIRLKDLADLLQESAWLHADSADFGRILLKENLMWALSRLDIKVFKSPVWGQKITVFTGGRGIEKLFAFREFLVISETGEVLARAMSSWLLVDTESKRIQRPEKVLSDRLFSSEVPDWRPEKLELPSLPYLSATDREVATSDLDLYNHVNNTSYIRWVEDLIGSEEMVISGLVINYLAECKNKDLIRLSLHGDEDSCQIVGEIAGRKVFLATAPILKD